MPSPRPGEITYVFSTGIGFNDAVAQHAIAMYHDLDDALEDLFYQFINDLLPGF
jgi:hypothetical protein